VQARLVAGLAMGSVLLFATACGGPSAPASEGPQSSASAPVQSSGPAADSCSTETVADAQQVEMVAPHAFQPADVTVPVGGTVTWTNNTTQNHTVTFSQGPACGIVLIGKSISVTFNTAGTYTYSDDIYPQYMSGTVTVTP
jgi:plastocyanin